MNQLLTLLGGIALGYAGYKIGEEVQKKRAEKGDDEYSVFDLLDEVLEEKLESKP